MNDQAQDQTKSHYDQHANKHLSQEEALRARGEGPGLPLKRFHNTVKRKLIYRFANSVDSLLDLACGRGGDLLKWIDSEIKYVKGMDLSPGEIREATARYQNIKQRRPEVLLEAEFTATDELGKGVVKLDRQFDAVSCMFAIHYFFASQLSLDKFFHNVSINLRDGGYFFGTVPDGKKINEIIHAWGRWPRYDSPMLKLEALWAGEAKSFGCGYTCAIGDTVTEGHGTSSGSFEYLVYRSTLVGVAARHGFAPIVSYTDPDLERLFIPADKLECCKHFDPRFPETGDSISDSSLKLASKLNMAFAFQKTTINKPVTLPSNVLNPASRPQHLQNQIDAAGLPARRRVLARRQPKEDIKSCAKSDSNMDPSDEADETSGKNSLATDAPRSQINIVDAAERCSDKKLSKRTRIG